MRTRKEIDFLISLVDIRRAAVKGDKGEEIEFLRLAVHEACGLLNLGMGDALFEGVITAAEYEELA